MTTTSPEREVLPLYQTMNRIPGGLMLIPLVIGSVLGTFAPGFLGLGSFTTALFAESALPLIALLIFATGTQVTLKTSGPVMATAGVVLLCKSIIPATLVILLGTVVGIDGILGVSILALLVAVDNSNGGLWLAFTGRYGDKRDRGAYIASALNDGPFFSLLFLGASGLADIPVSAMVAAVIPFVLGMVVGNLNPHWREVLRPTPAIVIPFFALALGTGIDLNAIATPAIVALADPRFEPYVETATAQVAASVLVTAIIAPLLASAALKREGGLLTEEEVARIDDMELGIKEPQL